MARVPLYKAAETEMIRRIRAGEWAVGLRLPNEFGLADEFGVSQGTMRRALITLEGMGYLSRKPGRGTIVAKPDPAANTNKAAAVRGFDRLVGVDGLAPELEVFRARSGTRGADATEAALFGTARMATLERTLRRDGNRFALDEVVVPETLIPALPEDAATDLVQLLHDAGQKVSTIEDHVSAAVTTMSDSVALTVDRHTALLIMTRVARDASNRALARQVLRFVAGDVAYAVSLGD
ncbi:MAG: GntR family transcriptional regulator [Roseicyclus sp.]